MSRRGILIRVLIFVPLFAYFGYGAIQKYRAERQAEADAAAAKAAQDAEIKAATRQQALPSGQTIEVVELTPEQAERLYGLKAPPPGEEKPAPATEAKTAPPEAKTAAPPETKTAPPTEAAPPPAAAK